MRCCISSAICNPPAMITIKWDDWEIILNQWTCCSEAQMLCFLSFKWYCSNKCVNIIIFLLLTLLCLYRIFDITFFINYVTLTFSKFLYLIWLDPGNNSRHGSLLWFKCAWSVHYIFDEAYNFCEMECDGIVPKIIVNEL